MKKYFYTDGANKYGPFTIEELRNKNITKDTLVWFQGLSEWLPAHNFSELNDIIVPSPPPVTSTQTGNTNQSHRTQNVQPPKTWLVESILATLFCCLPFGIVGIVNASKVESRFYAGDIDGAYKASEEAGKWSKLSIGVGIAIGVLYMLFMLIGVASGF